MKHRFLHIALVALATMSTYATSAQNLTPSAAEALQQPEQVSHNTLSSRSALVPYPTRVALDEQAKTDMVIELDKWEADSLTDGAIRYTTRFKRNYRYDDRQLLLRIEDATGAVSVEVNDTPVGYNSIGIGRTEIDLTKHLKENHNTISITVLGNYAAKVLEQGRTAQTPSFRRATLITPPRVAIYDFVASTTFNSQGDGLLNLSVVMQSFLLNSKEYEVGYELLSPEGEVVAQGKKTLTTRMLSRDNVSFFARIPGVERWSPESPTLYKLVLYTYHERRPKEFSSAEIGFRTATLKEGALWLNGQPQSINATTATYLDTAENTLGHLQELRKSGYNMVCTPFPQTDEFYKICDRTGLLVCEGADIECLGQSTTSNNPAWRKAYQERALDAYYSARTHPSVVMFSIAGNAGNGICLYESYLALKGLKDELRPIVYPHAAGQWNSDL